MARPRQQEIRRRRQRRKKVLKARKHAAMNKKD